MVVRLISATTAEMRAMSATDLKQSILASEGRVILSENVVTQPTLGRLTTSELAVAFGADMVLLNALDVLNPEIKGLPATKTPIASLKKLIGRPLGANLEPVDPTATMLENRLIIPEGRQATTTTLKTAATLGLDFICLTGNPGTGVSNHAIEAAITLAKKLFSGLIIAGKMHGAGVDEPIIDLPVIERFLQAGADIILVPAVGTVPGITDEQIQTVTALAHAHHALVMSTIGTSQEGSGARIIEAIALRNKIDGVDIQHIGDAAWGIVSPFETLYPLSRAIRGERHTLVRMAQSINR